MSPALASAFRAVEEMSNQLADGVPGTMALVQAIEDASASGRYTLANELTLLLLQAL